GAAGVVGVAGGAAVVGAAGGAGVSGVVGVAGVESGCEVGVGAGDGASMAVTTISA
ncbi:hypothetical protein A2U01_0091443, partial [Trifolium medium]|nr:hypothetical protein [Trifolium medium]